MIDSDKILFIPSLRVGNGTGHLKRCLDWSSKFPVVHIYPFCENGASLMDYTGHPLVQQREGIVWHDTPEGDWSLLVLDNRETHSLPSVLKGIPVIAVDETGPAAAEAACLVNTLPMPVRHEINKDGYSFLNRPLHADNPVELKRILVSFGGEDPAGLADRIYQILHKSEFKDLLQSLEIDIIAPGLTHAGEKERMAPGLRVLGYIPELSKRLTRYDLILTQYGLTAFEALSSSRCVLILNPTEYHDKLTRFAGLPLLAESKGFKGLEKRLKSYLESDISILFRSQENLRQQYSLETEDFADWFLSMNISADNCPACGGHKRLPLARFEWKSYFRCIDCGMKYMVNFRVKEDIYTKGYFFEEYKNQYGKTYIEDFPHIRAMAAERLKVIGGLSPERGRLLDIGCAYGPFLLSASEVGYQAEGVEISDDAVKYIRDNFSGISVIHGNLLDIETRKKLKLRKYRAVTLWYVIEHFSNLQEIIPHLYDIIESGGVLAMATPYAAGVSGRFKKRSFFCASPEDHFTIWDRRSAVRILRNAGFGKIRFRSTGHHPERFPAHVRRFFPSAVLMMISRAAGWGDTFEIYAVKGKRQQ